MKISDVSSVLEHHNNMLKEQGVRYLYILELVVTITDLKRGTGHKASYHGGYHLRLKGKNGEIIMSQECTSYVNARKVAAKLLSKGGLLAKYKETKIKNK